MSGVPPAATAALLLLANPKFTAADRKRIATAKNINRSWGNQTGIEHLAEAVHEGTLVQFLRAWLPEGDRR